MSAQPAKRSVKNTSLTAEVAYLIENLLEEHSSEFAALQALAHDFIVLLADADRSASRGYLRDLFSQGARPIAEKTS